MSDPQRTWANIGLRDMVKVQLYDPFSQGGQAYLGSADIEVSFASVKKRPQEPYDQDVLGREVIRVCYGYHMDLRDLLLTQPGFQ